MSGTPDIQRSEVDPEEALEILESTLEHLQSPAEFSSIRLAAKSLEQISHWQNQAPRPRWQNYLLAGLMFSLSSQPRLESDQPIPNISLQILEQFMQGHQPVQVEDGLDKQHAIHVVTQVINDLREMQRLNVPTSAN